MYSFFSITFCFAGNPPGYIHYPFIFLSACTLLYISVQKRRQGTQVAAEVLMFPL